MTVTEVASQANTSEGNPISPPGWNQENWGDCWRTITRHHAGRYYQVAVSCKHLDCDGCGPRIRLAAYEEAVVRHALEPEIWTVYVQAHEVDKLRKRAGREGQPIESVPVADDWNVVFSPYHFEGAVQLDTDEVRRIFMKYRISRRQHTKSGVWAKKKGESTVQGETLSREYISTEAFKEVAKDLGATVKTVSGSQFFDDPKRHPPEHVKRLFLKKEEELRRKRLRERGVIGKWSYSSKRLD